jgi:hypothetical protein
LITKRKPKPDPKKKYVAMQPIAGETRTVKTGDVLPGSDPFVIGNYESFFDEATPAEERPSLWDLVDDPVEHAPHVHIPPSIPPYRQVRATVNVWFDGGFAPGSTGAKSGRPSGFGTAITIGKIYDALSPAVRQHPEWFRYIERDVLPEDLDRLDRGS